MPFPFFPFSLLVLFLLMWCSIKCHKIFFKIFNSPLINMCWDIDYCSVSEGLHVKGCLIPLQQDEGARCRTRCTIKLDFLIILCHVKQRFIIWQNYNSGICLQLHSSQPVSFLTCDKTQEATAATCTLKHWQKKTGNGRKLNSKDFLNRMML